LWDLWEGFPKLWDPSGERATRSLRHSGREECAPAICYSTRALATSGRESRCKHQLVGDGDETAR
jgi:hypothetical protein